jgi:hypothetical protein
MKLYEINETLEAAWMYISDLIESEEENENGQLEKMERVLSDLDMSKSEKLLNYARLIKNTKADALAIKAEKDRLAARQKTLDSKVDWLSGAIKASMSVGEKIQDETCVIGTRKSQRLEMLTDAESLPESYQMISYSANKVRLKKDIKEGLVCTFAQLVDDFSVSIK